MELDEAYVIRAEQDLRQHYRVPSQRALDKQLERLEQHGKRFIQHSPFLCISTSSEDGWADCSPKGDAPGFVKILDDQTIAIPDRPGNNRLDSLTNLLANPRIGLVFLIPGVDETLRINGRAEITTDPDLLAGFEVRGKLPTTAIVVHIEEAYLHCPKALIRADLWSRARNGQENFPTLTKMLTDQLGENLEGEELEKAEQEYQIKIEQTLY